MIREHGYTHWEGKLVERRFSWWPITRLNLKLVFKKKYFRPTYSLAFLPAFFFIVGIYISERMEDFRFMVRGNRPEFLAVNPNFFKNYIAGDFLLFLLIGLMTFCAGLVADDLRHSALPLYFSRPLQKKDYLVGKAAVIAFLVLSLTLVPGLILILIKILFAGSFAFLKAYPWLPLSIVIYSFFLTAFFCLYTILLSTLSRNSRYVAVMIFAIYIFSDLLFGFLYAWFKNPYLSLFSLKINLQQLAAFVFQQKPPQPVSWFWSFLIIISFMVAATSVIIRKIKAVEVIQ
ncbi:MAG: ABC transporter permease [Candidatus Aminicenantales bacterium]